MAKRLSTHHCAGSKRFFCEPSRCKFIFICTANLSIRLSRSIKTSNYLPCFGLYISLYTWCPLIKVSISKVVIKTVGSSSCKQTISVVILKANILVHNMQTCNYGFFFWHKIMQWNDVITFSKHYSNVLIGMLLWMKVFIYRKLFTGFLLIHHHGNDC